MKPLEQLCLEAKTLAAHRASPQFRELAAREAERIPFPTAAEHGPGKAGAARALRELLKAVPRFGDAAARDRLVEAAALTAEALRTEPDRPPPGSAREPFWLRDGAELEA